MSHISNILSQTVANTNFRQVIFTGEKTQLVIMNLQPGEDIGLEVHDHVEQILFNLSGQGEVFLDGEKHPFNAGDVLIVSAGVNHNVTNIGDTELKIYTIYSPANHIDGRIHATKVHAELDTEDEAFGHQNH